MSELALKLIEENITTKYPSLDLSNCGMREISSEVTKLEWLEELIIGEGEYWDPGLKELIKTRNKGPINSIKELPVGLGNLKNLNKLVFSGYMNYLKNQSKGDSGFEDSTQVFNVGEIGLLRNLRYLTIIKSNLTNCSFLSTLVDLKGLTINTNKIANLSFLENLEKLEYLDVSYNNIDSLSYFSKLNKLVELSVTGNKLTTLDSLPENLHIRDFIFFQNSIEDITPVTRLKEIETLYFDHNLVNDISVLSGLHLLRWLSFISNKVTQIRPLIHLPALEMFFCSNCPISDCPADVYETNDPRQLKAYFEAQTNEMKEIENSIKRLKIKKEGSSESKKESKKVMLRVNKERSTDSKRDVKLIILGNSNAGKTNLVNYLEENKFTGLRKTTHGLEVHRWHPDEKLYPSLKDVTVSIWDFGGQEYYHGAYRLFLSSNAVYVLLWCNDSNVNGRRKTRLYEDGPQIDLEHFEIKYWLDTIHHYSGGKEQIALLAVQNKTDNPDTDKKRITQELHEEYGIRDSYHISLLKGSDKKNGRQFKSLQYFINELESIIETTADKATIPSYWQRVRSEILALKNPNIKDNIFAEYIKHDLWISIADFKEACDRCNDIPLTDDDLHTLPRWLDRGGVLVYFPGIPRLKDRLFIRPDQLAARIYEILDDEVHKRGGEFSADELFERKNKTLKTIFLEITQYLDLIFKHPDTEKKNYFIAPQYLPDKHPVEDLFKIATQGAWQSAYWIRVPLFYYKKVLHGLLLHFAADPDVQYSYFWKHGIMFTKDGLRVMIKGLYPGEDECEGTILIGVEKDLQKQQPLQKVIFNKILDLLTPKINMTPVMEAIKQVMTKGEETGSETGVNVLLSYDGVNYVYYNDLLRNSDDAKIKAFNSDVWLVTQQFTPLLPFTPPKAKRVFLSYSHQNTAWLSRLRTHLAGLCRNKEIETWDDKEILPGELWDDSIKKSIDEADVFILLLSADFIASEYIWDIELKAAFEKYNQKKAEIIPVLLEPLDLGGIPNISQTDDKQSFKINDFEIIPKNAEGRLQAVSLWQNQEEALATIAERIRTAIKRKTEDT